jgi:hypothetical protein
MELTRTWSRCSGSRLAARSSTGPHYSRRALSTVALALAIGGAGCGSSDSSTTATATSTPQSTPAIVDVYAALGDAYTAGMVSTSLVQTHQASSFPALIARQGGTRGFQQPLVSEPGIDIELILTRYYPPPIVIGPKAETPGGPLNGDLAGPFNNLGVPGATVGDLVATDGTAGGFHGLVLRNLGTALSQGLRLHPSLITLWTGNSDILTAVVQGRAIDGITLTPNETFRARYQKAIDVLRTTPATIVAANIPDLTKIPYVTTIKPYVVDPATGQPVLRGGQRVPLIGPTGTPLPPSSFVTLAASQLLAAGDGIPVSEGGRGTPLPDEVVLDTNEVDIIRERIAAHNRVIQDVCGRASIPIVDMHTFFDDLSSSGKNIGGLTLTSDFLTGGFFSYDGVHPSELGYALLTNEWIKVLTQAGLQLSLLDLSPIMGLTDQPLGLKQGSGTSAFEFTEAAARSLRAIYPLRNRAE